MKRVFLITALFASFSAIAQNTITIQADKARDTISRFIYGHFAEHLGRCIYGGVYVGEGNQKIPNKNGIRLDVVEALKKLKVTNLRWPGGCFADAYHWKDGIGPKSERKHIENVWWGNVREDNSFGTHEFLELCGMIQAEPYLAVNVGSGTVTEAAEWVQYVNHANGSSALADLRQKNGRSNPWKVKYWGVGNESWGCGGNMTVEYYANLYKQYATFMTSYWNSERLFRIASGPGSPDYHWTEVLMRDIPRNMLDGISIHHYSVINWGKKGSATNFSEQEYYTTLKEAYRMEELVSKHSETMDKYDPEKKVALIVDEWGGWYDVESGTNGAFLYQQNTMRDATLAGITLNIFHNHCDRVRVANLAQMVNVLQAVILTNEEKIILTPTYHVMEMYNVHQDALMLPISKTTNKHVHGKDTLDVISVSASRDKNGVTHVSLVNIDSKQSQTVSISLEGAAYKTVSGRILKSGKIQDYNSFEKPNAIVPATFNEAKIRGNKLETTLPPFSIVVLELK